MLESAQPAVALDQPGVTGGGVEAVEQRTIAIVVALAGQQRRGEGIAHGADADLQGAAVAHQGAGVQADTVVLKAHWQVGGGKQRAVVAR